MAGAARVHSRHRPPALGDTSTRRIPRSDALPRPDGRGVHRAGLGRPGADPTRAAAASRIVGRASCRARHIRADSAGDACAAGPPSRSFRRPRFAAIGDAGPGRAARRLVVSGARTAARWRCRRRSGTAGSAASSGGRAGSCRSPRRSFGGSSARSGIRSRPSRTAGRPMAATGTPIDDHRASAAYRRAMLGQALPRLVAGR